MSAKQLLKRILWLVVVVCAPVAVGSFYVFRDGLFFLTPAESFSRWIEVPVEIFNASPVYAVCLYALFLFSLVWWLVRFNARSSCALLLMAFVAGPSSAHIDELFALIAFLPTMLMDYLVS